MDAYPALQVDLLKIKTKGDKILDKTLSKIGGKGLFIKELEHALLSGEADLAVHSLKDVPVIMPPECMLAGILKRAEYRDAFVSNKYQQLSDLPAGAVVGTSSLRRESQIRDRYPELTVRPLRGNLDTRLAKLDAGEFDAIILAACGLQRMDMSDRIRSVLSIEESLPAVGQGALALEVAANRKDLLPLFEPLCCKKTTTETMAERIVSAELGGSCQVPLAVFANYDAQQFSIQALVAMPDGSKVIRASRQGSADEADKIALEVATELKSKGGAEIVQQAASL